ncbi:zinc finger CCCH domain-containing protein 55-like [Lycium ferocissimum]|uniref:zinc finger CCCH domain-containing protein 55-like n=1 Tax=Lycium ferocissimum TaxID=112874 RepID=UPI002814AE6D|nr:zinc finger CCCH domain-containing protein 55-like [Lycium ferocissimum]
MGENAKRRKSLWDEEDTRNSPDYEEWGPPKADNSWQSKNKSGWSSGDNVTGAEELRKENYHYKSMSPAFDRRGRRSNSQSPDNGRAQSRRYPGRARSRSRGRGEGRSRSRSRGRDRFRTRSRSRSRSRDRDRDRDRDRGSMRVQNRSHSPLHNSKRDPYASGDRRTGPRMSSQVCRDFAAGNCRRGSDCRFFHPDGANHRDGGHSEDNLAERLGSRPERGHISRYAAREGPGYQSRDRLPDMHHLEDELHRNRSRGTITCRDFVKGNCRWGASCRFSHDGASGDNYDKGTRSASFDHGQDNQASRTGKSLCKYFAAGKCLMVDCKFSHDATSRNHEIRPSDDIGGHRFDDKNNNWLNGQKWDDEGRPSDLVKASGWDESVVRKDTAVTVLPDRTNERPGHSFENENRVWGRTEPQFMNSDRERGASPHMGSAGNPNALNISESSVIQNFTNTQDIHLASQPSDLNMERTSAHVLGHNSNQEASGIILSATATQPYGSAGSFVQPQGLTEDSIARTLGSNAVNEFMNTRDIVHHARLPGQSFSGTGIGMSSEHSAVLNGTHQELNVFLPIPSTGHNKREAPGTPEMPEFKFPQNLSGTVTGEQLPQMETSPTSMIKNFGEGLREAQLQRVLNPSGPSGMPPSNPISSLVHAIYGQINPEMRVSDNYHPPDGLELDTSANFKLPPDSSSYLDRDSNKVPMEQMNQSSTVDPELGNNDQIDEVKQQENKLVEVNGKDKLAPEESKDGQENDHPGAMNMHGKADEGNGNKDEKVMRLFKNALIEFVKEILKPIWKEGKMSREVHKTVVKKVVDKVTSTIQGEHVPKTQEKIEQYLAYSKPKITKLVQAYVERLLKNEA